MTPKFFRQFHFYASIVWLVMSVPSILLWRESVPYLVFLSVYAVFVGHWSSWQAARSEVEPSLTAEDLAALRRVIGKKP